MSAFRKTIIRRTAFLSAIVLICAALVVYDVFLAPQSLRDSAPFAFLLGLSLALGFMSIVLLNRCRQALRDAGRLKSLYLKETDERMAYVKSRSGQPLILVTSMLMLLAAVITGHFLNIATMKALAVAAFAQLLISTAAKIHYLDKTGGES